MINVTKTYLPVLEKYQGYVKKIFESGWLTNSGQFTIELERKLADYLQVPYIILVSNGTLALQIAYRLLNLKDEVITTPFSFVATTSSLVWEKTDPVFADIDDSLNISPKNILDKITPKTSAIVGVHVYGNPCDHESIEKIIKAKNIPIIYDAAHAFGVNYKGKSVAHYGDISVFSFHATKIFHTIEGGAIIVRNKEMYDKAKLLINFGIPDYDQITTLGINCKMNEFQAAMGLCLLDEINNIISSRKVIVDKYNDALKGIKKLHFPVSNPKATNNYAYYPVIFESEEILLRVKGELNHMDIYPRRYFYPSLEKLPYIKPQYVPVADSISTRVLCLPLYTDLEWKIQKGICEIIKKQV